MLDTLCLQAPALTGAAPAFAAGPVDWSMGFVPCGEWHTAGGAAACVLHLQQKQILLMSIRGWGLVLLACGGLWEQGLAELPGLQALAPRRGYDEVDLMLETLKPSGAHLSASAAVHQPVQRCAACGSAGRSQIITASS